jgi:hypothetical protein
MKTQFAYQGPTLAPAVLALSQPAQTLIPAVLIVSQRPAARLSNRYLPVSSSRKVTNRTSQSKPSAAASPFVLMAHNTTAPPSGGQRPVAGTQPITQLVAETLSAPSVSNQSVPRGRGRLVANSPLNQDEIEEALDIIFPGQFPPLISPSDDPNNDGCDPTSTGIKAYGASGLVRNSRRFPASFGS